MEQLLEAVKNGDCEQVERLLDADPSLVNARTPQGVMLAAWAAYCRQPEVARIFLERGVDLDLFGAVTLGDECRLRELIGADPALVNAYAPDGFFPLGLACFFGQAPIVRYLLERGADVTMVSREGMKLTALHSAVARGDAEIVTMLLDHGAPLDPPHETGFVPLHSAAAHGSREICEMLLARGANPAARMKDGKTADQLAEERGHTQLAAWLREKREPGVSVSTA